LILIIISLSAKITVFISPRKQVVYEDDRVEFLCYGSSKRVRIYWMMEGPLPLPSYAKVDGPVLTIGDEELTAELIVKGKLESSSCTICELYATYIYCYIRVDVGQPVKLNCSTNYPENATFLWKRIDEHLLPIRAKVDSPVLKIQEASYLDSGRYACKVKTVSGIAETSAEIYKCFL